MKQNRKEILKTIFKLFLTRHYEDVSYDDMINAKNGADCYSKNGDAVTVLTWQS